MWGQLNHLHQCLTRAGWDSVCYEIAGKVLDLACKGVAVLALGWHHLHRAWLHILRAIAVSMGMGLPS
jgi:hypothetical protein